MNTTYQQTLLDIEHDLHAPPQTVFPVQIELGNQTYQFQIWDGQHLPDQLLAIDCETRRIEAKEIPELALVSVYGQQAGGWFIHPSDLAAFLKQHSQAYWTAHNAVFDFWVIAQHLQDQAASWWDAVGSGRLLCTMLLDCLLRLAKTDEEPISRDLGTVAAEYCGVQLNKDDPYRLRYGELIGRPKEAWPHTEPGFWTYAAADPVATYRVAQEQIRQANKLIAPYQAELLPDAIRRFGPLTCCLQVQGAISLDYASRLGVSIDLQQTEKLQDAVEAILIEQIELLEELGGSDVFKRYGARSKKNGYQKTPNGVVRRNSKAIKQLLADFSRAYGLKPKRNKDGLVTDSTAYWKQHVELDPFIAAYVQFREQAKLLEFFQKLDQPQIYPKYRPLVRTGRTSCSNPNLQQLPRDTRFRELVTVPPGYLLLQVDYAAIELRTLAQVCLRRYGQSILAELFRQGIDPHVYTARLLMGKSQEQFEVLLKEQQKRARQRAKAINFGVPGGLGATTLVAYAKYSYGVELTIQEAKAFRKKLTTKIYPELASFLQDRSVRTIARNLQADEAQVRQLCKKRDSQMHASRIIAGVHETPDGEEYEQKLIDHVWFCLQQLNRNPDLQPALQAKKPSSLLMRKIFCGHALTLSGRLRGHVGFTQACNTPFSGLAADGNKLALFRLLQAGYLVCGFVHDEVLVLIPEDARYTPAVQHVQQIMADAMAEVCPDVPIETEFLLGDRWYKDAEQPLTPEGKLIPYRKRPTVPELSIDQQRRAAIWQKKNEGIALPF